MSVDFLERLPDQSADPDANVGGHAVHQPEPGNHFEFVNVQLQLN
jgi:hypothetical protein